MKRDAPVPVGTAEPRAPLRRSDLTLILGSWAVYGVVSTGQRVALAEQMGQSLPLAAAIAISMAGAAIFAGLTIVIFWLSRRFPLDRRPRLVAVIVHIVASPIIAAAESVSSYAALFAMAFPVQPFLEHFWQGFPFNIVVYWLVAGVAHGMTYYRRYRERDAQALQLSRQLAHAELQALKSQLHPHFLFNALNTISALMHRDVKAADRMLCRLSDLLRAALDHTSEQEVPLLEELNFLESYLEIEQIRLAERLIVEIDVPPNVLDAMVPHMILQPLVENAIRHGVAPRKTPGTVTIRARGRREMLDIEVTDDGPGVPAGRSANGGLGLANTKARLEQLYAGQFSFEPRNRAEGGFRVSLSIPFRPIDEAEPTNEEQGEHSSAYRGR
jgi:signal transduction histidine kinase